MDKRILQTFAVWAKDNLERQIEVSLKTLGVNGDNDFRGAKKSGEYTVIDGDSNSYPADLLGKRQEIINQIRLNGYKNIIEEYAYTWFNRLVALRFMELHNFLPHGFRVLSSTSGSIEPDILKNLNLVKSELRLDMDLCGRLKEQNKTEELFRYVLICQCNALSDILPMLFSRDLGYMELLLPKSLLIGETVLTRLVDIPEENFMNDVEIIGWMYQFYISSKKDAVNKSKKTITKDTLPAVTQLFTPDWIVRYMAENSVGRIWMESYPQSPLRGAMDYYVDDPEQTEEVQTKLNEIRYKNVNPEEIRVIEPCAGSGHILVYVMELLYRMYEEKGYNRRDIPTLILKNNLVGLDVDKRASQLASFALIMKARTLNNRFFKPEYYVLPQVYEIHDSRKMESLNYRQQMKELDEFSDAEIKAVSELVKTFENGKTIGSLIKVPELDYASIESVIRKLEHEVVRSIFNTDFVTAGTEQLKLLLKQAKVLSAKYDVQITNPPYIGISSMDAPVKEYAAKNYPNSKTDMFAMFMETGFVKPNGFTAMINMHSWMFLSSYENLRTSLLNTKDIVTMAHLDTHAFDEIKGEVVQTTSFVMRSSHIEAYLGSYQRLVDGKNEAEKADMFRNGMHCCTAKQSDFSKISGSPVAYWIGENMLRIFELGKTIGSKYKTITGSSTGENASFLRLWYEIDLRKIGLGLTKDYDGFGHKWIPCNKGGSFRRWYGNTEYVINWENDGASLKAFATYKNDGKHWSRFLKSLNCFYHEGITWSKVASRMFCARYMPEGFIMESAACAIMPKHDDISFLLALMNTKIVLSVLRIKNPTINMQTGDIIAVPIITQKYYLPKINDLTTINVSISRADWDSFETSWDFQRHPLVRGASTVEAAFDAWAQECEERFQTLKANEEELNRIFIDIYGLQDELTPEVEDKDVTVRLADRERDVKSLISYLVGVVMGRYSLDVPGLAFAGGEWDESKYRTYKPDDDGIVPIYRGIGMEDGLTTALIRLMKQIYGEDTYRQNMDFIAESLGKNNNESSEETLNRYLNDEKHGFYANHLKIYQKRPIYWLFSSGDNGGFKCLVYMHRYTGDTLARMNSRYFLPESTRLKNDLEEISGRLAKAEGRDRVRLEKERQRIAAAYHEAIEYGQVLDHMANQYIEIDLDDGVKVNYAKFQNVEMVTDSGNKVTRNLLALAK